MTLRNGRSLGGRSTEGDRWWREYKGLSLNLDITEMGSSHIRVLRVVIL